MNSPRVAARTLSASTRSATRPTAAQITSPIAVAGRRQYHEKVLDHYSRPRNVGSMSKTDADVGTGLVGAPACGDVMKLQIRVDPTNNTISDVRGMTLEEAGRVRNTEIAKELCLPPVKRKSSSSLSITITDDSQVHCSMLAEDAIKSAISNYYTKNPKARSTDLGGTGSSMPKIDVETVMEPTASQTATA